MNAETIKIIDADEIQAVIDGKIRGEIDANGECLANAHDLTRWRNEQPIAVLEANAGVST